MRILITGSSGQLGMDALEVLGCRHQVTPMKHSHLDITDLAQVERAIRDLRPEIILNCAAYTRVDDCEDQRELAFAVNVTGPRHLAMGVQEFGGKLIHISTDYVFDGWRAIPNPYVEDDKPAPLSCYGETKLESERIIGEITDRFMIVRTAWLYGADGRNFLKTILRVAMRDPEREIRVVDDQFGSPTWSYRLAQQIDALIEAAGSGIYHATAEGYCTWYGLARAFLKTMGVAHRLSPCTSGEYPTRAVRPRNSILENHRLKTAGHNCMRHWEEDLEEFLGRYRDRLLHEALPES